MKLIAALFFVGLIASIHASVCPNPSAPSYEFDINKYIGTWYEIERSQTPHEDGVKCNTAHYTLLSNGKINITNSGLDNTGHRTSINLSGSVVEKEIPNYFSVVLSPRLPPASYWVVDTDFKNYSAVICCYTITKDVKLSLGYILSRKPTLDDNTKATLEKLIYSKGANQMFSSDQSGCTY